MPDTTTTFNPYTADDLSDASAVEPLPKVANLLHSVEDLLDYFDGYVVLDARPILKARVMALRRSFTAANIH